MARRHSVVAFTLLVINVSLPQVASWSALKSTSTRFAAQSVQSRSFQIHRISKSRLWAQGASTPSTECEYDVIVIGAGPAGCSLAALLAAAENPPKVALLSSKADQRWIPNYGCWTEEWAQLDAMYAARGVPGLMATGVDTEWPDTDCFFGEGDDGKLTSKEEGEGNRRRILGRGYLRVSRTGLKGIFYGDGDSPKGRAYDVIKEDALGTAISTNVYAPHGSITLHPTHTELTLVTSQQKLNARVVVDATGAESSFTIRDDRDKEGYQIAYGVECKVGGLGVTDTHVGDYARSKMTLFDYRSESWRQTNGLSESKIIKEPTFNYVMPLSQDVIFFEETSLVARPAVSFQDCKDRLTARLASQGVTITEILEEEYCYIPMGGAVPRRGQRIVPVGAAAGTVHPSTGYHLARCLASNLDVCEQILEELKAPAGTGSTTDVADTAADKSSASTALFDPDSAASRILGRTWTPQAIRQRNFALFGGDFLMQQDVHGLKGFFSGFFQLEQGRWAGFLAGWQGLPNHKYHATWLARLVFGVAFLTKLPLKVALRLVGAIVSYTLADGPDLIQSVTPLLGEPLPFSAANDFKASANGDVQAKKEAAEMMRSEEHGK